MLPVRNGEPFIGEALRSLQRQTLDDFEIIVVDDGSVDETASIVQVHASGDPRIRLITTPARGLVSALNLGIDESRSELVARIDADDLAHPERLELQISLLEESDDVDVVSSLVRHFPDSDVGKGFRVYEDWLNSLTDHASIMRDRFIESPVPHPSVMVRKRVLDAVGRYRDLNWPEDYDLWLRLADHGSRFSKVPRVLCLWRQHDNRLTRVDGRYAVEKFLACKAFHLAQGPLSRCRQVVIWGAGQTGRRLSKHLRRYGCNISAFLDIDPKKIGKTLRGLPISQPDDLPRWWRSDPSTVILAAVSSRGARDLIRRRLDQSNLQETSHYWCVA